LQDFYLPPVVVLMKVIFKTMILPVILAATSLMAVAWHEHIHPPPDPGVARVLEARQAAREQAFVGHGRINNLVYNRLL